jgi:hypothetical protein
MTQTECFKVELFLLEVFSREKFSLKNLVHEKLSESFLNFKALKNLLNVKAL